MSDDLVSRLRDANAHSTQRIFGSNIFDEAASALTEARAEIERLREQVFELEHGVEDQMEEAAYHAKQRAAAESELSTLRARVREVVGPFADLAQQYDDTVSDGWVSWAEFVADHAWPTETNGYSDFGVELTS